MHYRYRELLGVAIVQLVVYVAFILLGEHTLARFCTDNVRIFTGACWRGYLFAYHYSQVFYLRTFLYFTTIKFFLTPD